MEQKKKTRMIIGVIVWVALVVIVALGVMLVRMLNDGGDTGGEAADTAFGVGGEDLSGLYEKYPVLRSLPLEIDYFTEGYANRVKYTISYKLDDSLEGFKIVITDEIGNNYEDALNKLRARGIEPNEYVIEYEKAENINGKAW